MPAAAPAKRRIDSLGAKSRIIGVDKAKLTKMINSSDVEAVAIASTASRPERDRLVRDFVKKAERAHDGEVVLVVIRT